MLGTLLIGLLMSLLAIPPTYAASEAPPAFTSQAARTTAADDPSQPRSEMAQLVGVLWSTLLFEQHKLTEEMTGAVREIKSTTDLTTATSALVIASFVYGILHAVGPGHGKAVISSYMLADKQTLKRGVVLAFLSSVIQALSAIVLIGGLFLAAKATGLQTRKAEAWLETASWGCVALVGAYLMIKQVWLLARTRRRVEAPKPAEAFEIVHPPAHVHGEHCNHAHLPEPETLGGDFSLGKALALAFSVGIRPCTGALLVLVFASAQGLVWAGVLATFAMAVGTAITVSALAALSVGSRNMAIYFAGEKSRWGSAVAHGASLLSSTLVFLLGSAFFVASLQQPMRPF